MLDRRTVLTGGVLALLPVGRLSPAASRSDVVGSAALRALETRANGRLGACVFDPVSGRGFGWREAERFTQASSFKMSLAAMLLAASDAGRIDLEEVLRWTSADMLSASPVTGARPDMRLSVRDLARATLVTSDNTAANVLMRRFGGPAQLTRFWRSIGDTASRLDRYEPALNETPPGTSLDTTTPRAMARTTAALVHGTVLAPASRALFRSWLTEVKTGQGRIRSGFPGTWLSGDKTGTGIGKARHVYVDLAFGGPPGRVPLIVTAYFEPSRPKEPIDQDAVAVLAAVGRIAAASLTP